MTPLHVLRALERALLAYTLLVLLVLTLSPFRFAWPASWAISWFGDYRDMPANVLLFLPVGYFFRLSLPPQAAYGLLRTLGFGCAVSLAIESAQLFIPARMTSFCDVVANTSGAFAGAVLCNALVRHVDRLLPSVMTLAHPLVNIAYLSLPLMWLTGIAAGTDGARVWLLLPLGAVGGLTLVGLWRHWYGAAVSLPRPLAAGAILGWFACGALTGLAIAPVIALQCAGLFAVLVLTLMYVPTRRRAAEARFEHAVLVTLWPWFIAYLVLATLLPHEGPLEPFVLTLGYPEFGFDRRFTLRIAEQIGALTLFGYLLAESSGRLRLAPRARLFATVAGGAVVALAIEALHGFLAGDRASVVRWLLTSSGAAFGAMLYTRQLDVVRMLRRGET